MTLDMDKWQQTARFAGGRKTRTLLPDPEPRTRSYTIFSVDDHVVEPPSTFEGRIPQQYIARAPRVIDLESGGQAWLYDEKVLPQVGLSAVAGRPIEEMSYDPTRFDEMRRGTWDVRERIRDMDLNGIYASVNFPSHLAGFAGGRLQLTTSDADLAFAVFQAYNDWHLEEWCATEPDRLIPVQLPWLLDPERGAAEIRRNAERGFRAVTFPEAPHHLGLPSIYSGHWDPILQACAETETVVCLHVGSGGALPSTAPGAPSDVTSILFGLSALQTAVDFLYSLIPVRFPTIKICLSEGGIGWVSGLIDRLEHAGKYSDLFGTWTGCDVKPAEALRRNFWFCALDDPSSFSQVDVIGPTKILVEVDYPHMDTSWPDSQNLFRRSFAGLSEDTIEMITWKNASELFGVEIPLAVRIDPNCF